MTTLSFINCGTPRDGVLFFRNTYPQAGVGRFLGSGANEPLKWYEGQQLRPNWYDYPDDEKRLKEEIEVVVEEQKAAQQELANTQEHDPVAVSEKLQSLSDRLNQLLAIYEQIVARLQARDAEEDEEAELSTILELADI